MSLTIGLPQETHATLERRAAATGQDVATYVSKLVQHFAGAPTPVEQLSGDLYRNFLASGMSDEELGDALERAKHEMRADRRKAR